MNMIVMYLGLALLIGIISVEPSFLLIAFGPLVILFILGFVFDFFSPDLGDRKKKDGND